MGTRNLTMVIESGATKIAQYGQWDGYPEGQGVEALRFLRATGRIEKLRKRLPSVKWVEEEEVTKYLESIGSEDGWVDSRQSSLLNKEYPYLSRNHGAGILTMITSSVGEVKLRDRSDFANNSLFNEWTYVIDLDKETFEVYSGFSQAPVSSENRFQGGPNKGGYYPVRLIKEYDLNDLPTEEEFIAEFTEDEE